MEKIITRRRFFQSLVSLKNQFSFFARNLEFDLFSAKVLEIFRTWVEKKKRYEVRVIFYYYLQKIVWLNLQNLLEFLPFNFMSKMKLSQPFSSLIIISVEPKLRNVGRKLVVQKSKSNKCEKCISKKFPLIFKASRMSCMKPEKKFQSMRKKFLNSSLSDKTPDFCWNTLSFWLCDMSDRSE